MEENDGLAFKERSLGEFMGHFSPDAQGAQFNYVRFTDNHAQPSQRMGPNYPNENIDPTMRTQRNFLFTDNYQSNPCGPFLMNSPNEILPTMVDVSGGNYVVYGTPNTQKDLNMPNVTNMHLFNKTNGTLTGFNDFGIDYSGTDYNLMRGLSSQNPQGISHYSQHNSETNCKAQLIENLVGNWASDQSGTYSPFGSSLGGIRSLDSENIKMERGNKKPRIIAEVRPMRPSYSDVLSKSIISNTKSNKNCHDHKQKISDVKIKNPKSPIGRALSGNGNILNRQHVNVVEESPLNCINSTVKKTIYKKNDLENEENLSKKWVSLDDLKEASRQNEYISLSDVKNKRNNTKGSSNKTHKKEKWKSVQFNNAKNANDKIHVQKKQEKIKISGIKKEESVPNVKFDIIKTKTYVGEERKGPSVNQNKLDQPKSFRRNVRSCQLEKPKKLQKNKRKEQEPCISAMVQQRVGRYGGILLCVIKWLFQLVMDVLGLSTHLTIHMCATIWASTLLNSAHFSKKLSQCIKNFDIFQRLFNAPFGRFKNSDSKKNKGKPEDDSDDSGEAKVKRRISKGLKHNISLPVTGDEAMKRLLACKGKDPYSILGVTQDCTDDDIKKYYKRQAFLVHPDKNNQPGAEEAFKILVHAFNLIGKPELRKLYDHKVEKTQVEQAAWTELNDLLSQLHKKMEYVANTIRCTNCNKRHKRSVVDRPIYAARVCAQCKIHHSVREGDIWAETSFFGLIWHYYACMDGAVYDITEWAGCQGSNLRNLKANTHNVQYRIVLGKQNGQKQKYQQSPPTSEPDLEEFLNNFYAKTDSGMGGSDPDQSMASGKKRKYRGKK